MSWSADATAAEAKADARKLAADEMAASSAMAAAHDHRGAYDHALGAWQLDNGDPQYLLAAAHEAVLAGLDDKAEPLFKQWLTLPNRDVGQDLQVRWQLSDIVKRRAKGKADQGAAASKAGDHQAARRWFLEAAALDPGEPEHLFGAAQEALAVQDKVAAARLLADYLKVAAPDAVNRPMAMRQVAELGGPATEGAKRATDRESKPAPDDDRRGFWLMVAGGALAVTAAGLLVGSLQASKSAADFHADIKASAADWGPAEDRAATLGIAAAVTGGVGLGVGGFGAWQYFGTPNKGAAEAAALDSLGLDAARLRQVLPASSARN